MSTKKNINQKSQESKIPPINLKGSSFLDCIERFAPSKIQKPIYETGFSVLDDALGGGFTPGLICLGAVSSLGKSTFALQLAHSIALHKNPVLFFSLEMRRDDVIAKAIIREWHKIHPDSKITVQDLLMNYKDIDSSEQDELDQMIEDLKKKKDFKFSVVEPDIEYRTAEIITNTIDKFRNEENNSNLEPFVVIDYLQIVAPPVNMRGCSDKQIVDYNLSVFKSYVDKTNLPILIISSFNRTAYEQKASFQAFKESGNIEYTSDIVMALQYSGVSQEGFDSEVEKQKSPRDVDLVILKQRYGASGQTITMPFYPEYNWFDLEDDSRMLNHPKLINGRLPSAQRHF
ncbi:MAG: hypothetical protein IKE52_07255 [Mogibacterium sp.]|nr:hypothetical protein [Mogibacterium sp.]